MDVQTLFLITVGMFHQVAGTILPSAYCWQAMDFARVSGLITGGVILWHLPYRHLFSWRPTRHATSLPLACALPEITLPTAAGDYIRAMRERLKGGQA